MKVDVRLNNIHLGRIQHDLFFSIFRGGRIISSDCVDLEHLQASVAVLITLGGIRFLI